MENCISDAKRIRHIAICDSSGIKDRGDSKELSVVYYLMEDMIADFLTKSLLGVNCSMGGSKTRPKLNWDYPMAIESFLHGTRLLFVTFSTADETVGSFWLGDRGCRVRFYDGVCHYR